MLRRVYSPSIILALIVASSLFAQSAADLGLGSTPEVAAASPDQNWGTQSLITYSVHSLAFTPNDSSTTYAFQSNPNVGIHRDSTAGSGCFSAGVNLPQGARIHNLILDFCDSNGTLDVGSLFFRQPLPSGNTTSYLLPTGGAPGCGTRNSFDLFADNIVIDNLNNTYFFRACLSAPDNTNVLRAMSIQYKLQVSPAPLTATFPNDVPTTHPFFRFVEALAAAGITSGCGPGSYCPDAPVTRGQMAVFLSAALGLHWPN